MDDTVIINLHQSSMIFLHIPKAAGSTLENIIASQYDRGAVWQTAWGNFRELPFEKRMNYRVIFGHLTLKMKLHEYLPQPCIYITLLREPIDRIISFYYYILNFSGHHLHKKIVSEKISLKDCFKKELSGAFSNLQTNMLTTCNHSAMFGKYDVEAMESAKNNLLERFALVGFTEEFDKFIKRLNKTFGWNVNSYMNVCENKRRPDKNEISIDTLSTIAEYNQMDIELYRFAKEKIKY